MASQQEEAKQFLIKAWNSAWTPDLSTMSEFYREDAVLSAFAPPKQTTWTGLDAIKAHYKEIHPVISAEGFKITRLDLINDSTSFYAAWDVVFHVKVSGQETSVLGGGIVYCLREDGKIKVMTAYEDPTPFVAMAMKGQMGPPA